MNVCMCRDCCCNSLKVLKHYDRPADHVHSAFDPEACIRCGACLERCQMGAIQEGDEVCEVDTARCIGCGLCMTDCPQEAISMVDKPGGGALTDIPEDVVDMNIKIALESGVA